MGGETSETVACFVMTEQTPLWVFLLNTLVWIQITVFLLLPDKIDNFNLSHSSWSN